MLLDRTTLYLATWLCLTGLVAGASALPQQRETPEGCMQRGHAAFAAREYAQAEQAFRSALEHPDVGEPIRGRAHFYLGSALGNQSKHTEAVELQTTWLERYPNGGERHYVLLFHGIYLRKLGREDEARACWEVMLDEEAASNLAEQARVNLGLGATLDPAGAPATAPAVATDRSVGVLEPDASSAGGYLVIRVALDDEDPTHEGFRVVAAKAAAFHEADTAQWNGNDESDLLAALTDMPHNVLFVVPPGVLDVNLHRRVLLASAGLDEDVFPDFAFGYLTAHDGAGVGRLWTRIEHLHREGLASTVWINTSVASAMESTTYTDSVPRLSKEAGFHGDHLYFGEVEVDSEVLARVAEWLPALSKASVIQMTGNGDPQGVWLFDGIRNLDRAKHWPYDVRRVGHDPDGEMPRITASDFRAVRLDSPVVWSGTCHSAATERVFVEGDIVSTFGAVTRATTHRLEADESLCLSLIEAGAAALLAPIAANHGMSVSRESDFALIHGATLGETIKSTYDDVHLQARGRPVLALQVAGEAERRDAFVMQGGGSNRILIGDPALAPFRATPNPDQVVEAVRTDDGFDVEVWWNEGWHSWAWDMFGTDLKRDWRIYARVPIDELKVEDRPIGFSATVEAVGADGEALPFTVTRVEPENYHGRRFLHLQANANRAIVERKEARALFRVRLEPR